MSEIFVVSGSKGQLGSEIISELDARCLPYQEIVLSDSYLVNKDLIATGCAGYDRVVFLHCAAKLWPKTIEDLRLNSDLPQELVEILQASGKDILFAFVSSINVIIPTLQDAYSQSKRRAERQLSGKDVIIFRPDLIWGSQKSSKHRQRIERAVISVFGRRVLFFPGPGHVYRPVHPTDTARTILNCCNTEFRGTDINIIGDQPLHIYELIRKTFTRKLQIIDLTFGIEKFFPDGLQDLLLKSRHLQQVVRLDRPSFFRRPRQTKRPNIIIQCSSENTWFGKFHT